jgi:hypothetical protein
MKPGLYTMPAAEYHADPAPAPSLSNSLIRCLLDLTPRHAWLQHPRLNPHFVPFNGEGKFDAGTVAHAMLLEGEDVCQVIDAGDWRTNAAKDARDAARKAGKVPLLSDQHAVVKAMVRAAREYVDSTPLRGVLERAKPEQTLVWREKSGVWCRARLDLLDLTGSDPLILDYKTTGVGGGPAEFARRNVLAHGYDTQSVFYPRGLGALGYGGARFMFLVQEDEPPFMCYLAEPSESLIELANSKVRRALGLWQRCLQSNQWPGYPDSVHQLEAPVWALKDEEIAAL